MYKLKKISDTCFVMNTEICDYYYFNESCSMLHRTDGPAIEFKNGEQLFYYLGVLHNDSGPAVIKDALKMFFLNGKEYTEEEFNKKKKK